MLPGCCCKANITYVKGSAPDCGLMPAIKRTVCGASWPVGHGLILIQPGHRASPDHGAAASPFEMIHTCPSTPERLSVQRC